MTDSAPRPPDPTEAETPAAFVQSLIRLKRWAGEPPLSKLRSLGGQTVSPDGATIDTLPKSTTSHVLRQTDRLPRWDFVKAFVTACLRYCDYPPVRIPDELERWRAGWAALTDPVTETPPASGTAPVAGPKVPLGLAEAPDRSGHAVELLARRVAREEDRARKGLLSGYSVASVSYGPEEGVAATRGMEGDLHSIGSFFSELDPQRLLIVGEPGAGKTVLAIELVLQLLEPLLAPDRQRGGHRVVPVRLNAARWTSGTPFATWLADQLAQDFGLPAGDATRLVQDRLVLPVLDGLDELDPEPSKDPPWRAVGLLAELNRYSHLSGRKPGAVVVTCRAERYAELTRVRVSLDHATRIHIRDLTTEQINAYLGGRWPEGHPCAPGRRGIQTALSGPSGAAVRTALATPWRLLLATTAVEAGADPADLLHAVPGTPPQAAAAHINERLLSAYVPAATKLAPRGGRESPYDPEQVRVWLQHLALHLRWQDRQAARMRQPPPGLTAIDLVPHLLWPVSGQRRVRALHSVLCAIFAVVAMWAFWVGSGIDHLHDLRDGLNVEEGLTLALMAGWTGIATGLALRPWPAAAGGRTNVSLRNRLTGGLLGALAGGPIGVLGGLAGLVLTSAEVFGPAFAIGAGLAGGLVFGAAVGMTAAGRRGGEHPPVAEVIRAEPATLLGFGLCGALTGLPPLRLAHAAPAPLAIGVAGAFALAFALGTVFKVAAGGWSQDAELAHPREALHRNPMIGVVFGLTGGVAAALVFVMSHSLIVSLACALVGGVTFGLAFGAIAWCRSMIGLLVAAGRGLLPLRLGTFLDWACEARLLRISGATYQFRHREFQDFMTPGNRPLPDRQARQVLT